MSKVIAGIGSRKTPKSILEEMVKIGKWCRENEVYVRSGHADGADWAFERGALEFCLVYLPWHGFNKQLKSRAQQCIVPDDKRYNDMTDKYHPAPERLSRGARLLMNRNSCQVLGYELNMPVDVVVFWADVKYDINGKIDAGGTGHALRIAEDHNIPLVNMQNPEFDTAEKVIARLNDFH